MYLKDMKKTNKKGCKLRHDWGAELHVPGEAAQTYTSGDRMGTKQPLCLGVHKGATKPGIAPNKLNQTQGLGPTFFFNLSMFISGLIMQGICFFKAEDIFPSNVPLPVLTLTPKEGV